MAPVGLFRQCRRGGDRLVRRRGRPGVASAREPACVRVEVGVYLQTNADDKRSQSAMLLPLAYSYFVRT